MAFHISSFIFSAAVTGVLTHCMLGNFACFFVVCYFFFFLNCFFSKKSFRNTIRVPNSLDPDLGPNSLQRLMLMTKVATSRERVKG